MRPAAGIIAQVLLISRVVSSAAASSWGFEDAIVSLHGKKAEVGAGHKEKYEALHFASSKSKS